MTSTTVHNPIPLRRRSLLLHGLRLLVTHPAGLVWTYVANLAVALLFSLRLHAQLSGLLDNSLAAQRLSSAFDLGVLGSAATRLAYRQPPSGPSVYAGVPLYVLIYLLLIPGVLAAFRFNSNARLGTLLSTGAAFFWRFVRITLLTILVSALILGPLFALQGAWVAHVDIDVVGVSAIYDQIPGILIILLVASFLRLYFDLVEVYTVQLDSFTRPNGKPDRRVRKALLPAWKALWRHVLRAYGVFVFLAILGLAAFLITSWIALHTLALPRVWPTFLLFQLGLLGSLAARFWQRAAETILAEDNPLLFPVTPVLVPYVADPQPDPEPATPSLASPDPGIYRHPVQPSELREPGELIERGELMEQSEPGNINSIPPPSYPNEL